MKKILLIMSLALIGCAASPPDNWRSLSAGELLKCGDSPNCVSSIETREKFAISPLRYSDLPEEAMKRLVKVLGNQKGTEVLDVSQSRIHAVRSSAFFGFKDDLFFVMAKEDSIIQVRSSARSGYYDFGVNRKQLEKIRAEF